MCIYYLYDQLYAHRPMCEVNPLLFAVSYSQVCVFADSPVYLKMSKNSGFARNYFALLLKTEHRPNFFAIHSIKWFCKFCRLKWWFFTISFRQKSAAWSRNCISWQGVQSIVIFYFKIYENVEEQCVSKWKFVSLNSCLAPRLS